MSAPYAQAADVGVLKSRLDQLRQKFEFEEAVVLVHIPQVPLALLDPAVARNRGYIAYPPQGLLYIASVFRKLGIPRELVDLNFLVLEEAARGLDRVEAVWQENLRRAISRHTRPFIGISCMFDATHATFRKVALFIRENFPGLCIAAGGVNATAERDSILKLGLADIVFSNEGEQPLESFYRYLRRESEEVPSNVSLLDGEGTVLHSPTESGGPVSNNILPEYELIPIQHYHKVGSISNFSRMNGIDIPYATVLAKRGCRAHCTFCGVRYFNGRGVRLREVEEVIDEMKHLHDKFGIKHFDWVDDDLVYERDASLLMFQRIAEELPDITWQANNGIIASALDPELMNAMRASHCIGYKVGLESGNDLMLRKVRKPTRRRHFIQFVKMALDFPEMFVAVNYIFGLPEENFGQMLDSLRLALDSKMDWNNFYLYQPLKNTDAYIAYGGMGIDRESVEHGKDAQSPSMNINPVRAGLFGRSGDGLLRGYDVFQHPRDLAPTREQLKEIWFTFNAIANFLRLPALYSEHQVRVQNAVLWLKVLSQAYPEDALMSATLYYLMNRLQQDSPQRIQAVRMEAQSKLKRSKYWQERDEQIGFSSFLDNQIPVLKYHQLEPRDHLSVDDESALVLP